MFKSNANQTLRMSILDSTKESVGNDVETKSNMLDEYQQMLVIWLNRIMLPSDILGHILRLKLSEDLQVLRFFV
jgi:hypothetical protein